MSKMELLLIVGEQTLGDLPLDHILLVQLLPQHRSDQQEAHRTALYQAKRRDDL
jgi:hypothetical protein